jgi:hypothetical protein
MNVRKSLLFMVIIMTAGCQPMAVERHDEGPMPVTLRVDDSAYWVEEWSRLMALPADRVDEALSVREQEFASNPDARSRLRLALLLAEGPPAVRHERRALTLLAGVEDDPHASASARALANLLTQIIREQLRSSDKINTLEQSLNESGVRVKELERQLQELTDIEQSIKQRETPVERKEK